MIRVLTFLLAVSAQAVVDFNRDVRPILSRKCFFCHGPDSHERKADLRLDEEAPAKATRKGVTAIVPGDPDASALMQRVLETDPDEIMPPPESHKSMKPAEIATLRQWIKEGAPYSKHWAYVPPKRHPDPPATDWGHNWVDRFIHARLSQEGLKPSPDADPVTLMRRLHFDLIGLPPSAADVAEFAKNPGSYEGVVDRLLASDRFGERMAMYWLDLVRFADTVGYHGDQDHRISPYRDYVIDAFNDNLPFDQFTRDQLAGDLIPESSDDQKIATGYNRLLQTSHEGGVQPKEYLAIYAADRVRNLSAVWMGATVGCAQCHDHKYDPYTTRDHYALAAFFADIDEAQHFKKGSNSLPTNRPPELALLTKRERAAGLDPKQARKTMVTVATKPRTMRILPRGNWLDDSGEIVTPAVPSFLGAIAVESATRLDLADWLTAADSAGPLTARVFANRYWYLFFGTGLSKVLDDFGGQGEPPVHPELLDRLALAYLDSGWDSKALVKTLVMSRAYRQASLADSALRERDPYNRLIARQSRYRLPAEMVRDNALAISGLLVFDYGGASVKPYQPAGYYQHLNFPTRKYAHHSDKRQWRRGVYMHWQRQFLHPQLRAMDAPTREECTAERPRSNTPTAALVLLNDPTFVEAARVFAQRILQAETEDRIGYAFGEALQRDPDADERQLLEHFVASNRAEYAADSVAAKALIAEGLTPVPEGLDAAELATWTAFARALLNVNETITRN
jgi:hypothetical protein